MPLRMTITRTTEKNAARQSSSSQSFGSGASHQGEGRTGEGQSNERGQPAVPSGRVKKPLRVFIADDSRLLTERLIALLATVDGVQIVGAARTVGATIRGIQHLRPDLVILDFQMPDGTGLDVLKAIKQGGPTPIVMMLTNLSYPKYRVECMRWGAHYFFDKSQEFQRVVETCQHLVSLPELKLEAIDRVSQQDQLESKFKSKTNTPFFPKHVLIVEDDDVNRWLASRLLEQKGYTVSTATNGEAALAAIEHESFDLILMDTQMPLLDGLSATRTIRQRERQTKKHIPIIAFTTETGADKAQRYWQAGMSSYLAKPIHTDEFYRTIDSVLALHERTSKATPLPPTFDYEKALGRAGQEVEVLQQLADRFLNTAPHLISAMRRAIAKDDPYNLDFAAHRLRTLADTLCARAVVELAERLELMSGVRNMSQAETTISTLEEELAHFKVAFAAATQKI